MILAIVSLFLVSFSSVGLFSLTTYQAIDSAFASLNYSLPKNWIVTDIYEPLPTPMYDTYKVEETTIEHFKNNLSHYVNSFKLGFYYFDSETKEEVKDRYVTGVRISLKAPIPFMSDYYKATTYEIVEEKL